MTFLTPQSARRTLGGMSLVKRTFSGLRFQWAMP